jgi:hypothetical protein
VADVQTRFGSARSTRNRKGISQEPRTRSLHQYISSVERGERNVTITVSSLSPRCDVGTHAKVTMAVQDDRREEFSSTVESHQTHRLGRMGVMQNSA